MKEQEEDSRLGQGHPGDAPEGRPVARRAPPEPHFQYTVARPMAVKGQPGE